jgi:hypothetical protein
MSFVGTSRCLCETQIENDPTLSPVKIRELRRFKKHDFRLISRVISLIKYSVVQWLQGFIIKGARHVDQRWISIHVGGKGLIQRVVTEHIGVVGQPLSDFLPIRHEIALNAVRRGVVIESFEE